MPILPLSLHLHPQRWAVSTFSNKTLVLDETTTSTGSSGMRLVVRRGVLRDGEGYTFTLTVLGLSGEEEGCASIRLSPNRPPLGGFCHLFPVDAVHALTTKVHFECTGECGVGEAGGHRGAREGHTWRGLGDAVGAHRLVGRGGCRRPVGVRPAAAALPPGPV